MQAFEFDNDVRRIHNFLSVSAGDFSPPLRTRVDLDEYASKLATHAKNLFVVMSGTDVGHAAFYVNDVIGKVAFLSAISVDRRHWGKGVASQLLAEVRRAAREAGMNLLRLEVHSSNHKAIALYNKLGFTRVNKPAGSENLFMQLDLKRD